MIPRLKELYAKQIRSELKEKFSFKNSYMAPKIEKIFSMIFVTPHFHKIHHHYTLPYTDKNYGNIFSIWDHIFKTASTYKMDDLTYGVDTHMDKNETTNIVTMLKIPFQKYRTPVGSKFSEQ